MKRKDKANKIFKKICDKHAFVLHEYGKIHQRDRTYSHSIFSEIYQKMDLAGCDYDIDEITIETILGDKIKFGNIKLYDDIGGRMTKWITVNILENEY